MGKLKTAVKQLLWGARRIRKITYAKDEGVPDYV